MDKKKRRPTKKEKKEIIPKRYNQRLYNRIFLGGALTFVLLSAGAMATNIIRLNAKPQIESVNQKKQEVTMIDYRLQNWSSNFVYYYFNFSSDGQEQSKQIEKLNSFYVEPMEIRSQGQLRQPTELKTSKLVNVTDKVITYLVSYVVIGGESVVTEFNIPYQRIKGAYLVSDLPYFTPAVDSQAKDLPDNSRRKLEKVNELSDEDTKRFDEFMKLFFTNYTTSQENLDLVSENIKVLSNSELKTVDFTSYNKKKGKTIAYVQVTFATAGNTRSENFTLELEIDGTSILVSKMIHGIK
ncbi:MULTISPECIES: conjugal transfer protein [Streptococcus]|uniref:Conjugal transfer protein n=1 Tax=Streptococcus caledonicus TaxID=2614158 RepID=A0ABW0UEN6_9STRE|nr:conjugal transfer protein [Streptococcus sp. S784/96/1]